MLWKLLLFYLVKYIHCIFIKDFTIYLINLLDMCILTDEHVLMIKKKLSLRCLF